MLILRIEIFSSCCMISFSPACNSSQMFTLKSQLRILILDPIVDCPVVKNVKCHCNHMFTDPFHCVDYLAMELE